MNSLLLNDAFAGCMWDAAWSISKVGFLTLYALDDVLETFCAGWEL